jgi:GT2 family glycosyltransferase
VKSLTIAIATYQRRDHLLRLLGEIDEQIGDQIGGIQIVVVVDGSTDGTAEAALALPQRAQLDVHWQQNRGLAAARNAGLVRAEGEIVWFLDDDLVPSAGLLERHRREHETTEPHLLLGPCRPSPSLVVGRDWLAWWDAHYAEPERTGRVERFDRFTVANLSGPAELFREAGGFDESFTGYGFEDLELGVRMLAAGVSVRFDAEATAWHDHAAGAAADITRKRSEGRNAVRLARLHPGTSSILFDQRLPDAPMRLLQRLPFRSARTLGGLSRFSAWLGLHAPRWTGQLGRGAVHLASAASYAAGVAEADRTLLPAALGRHVTPR